MPNIIYICIYMYYYLALFIFVWDCLHNFLARHRFFKSPLEWKILVHFAPLVTRIKKMQIFFNSDYAFDV